MSAVPIAPRQSVLSTTVFKDDLFKGKVLFCTGGHSGVCKGMTLAMMKHGADAYIAGRKLEKGLAAAKELSAATGRRCFFSQIDVRKPETLKEAVKKCIAEFGRIDYVIAGAGGNFLAPISNISENAFKTVIDIDILGSYNTLKATLPYIRETRGSIIFVSATLHFRGLQYQSHVSAAKAGVDALSAVVAVEEGPRGVRSNIISPGPIAASEGVERLTPKGQAEKVHRVVPLQRYGEFGDVNNATIFLFSEAANWVTGQIFVVDGGEHHTRTSLLPYPDAVLNPDRVQEMIKART